MALKVTAKLTRNDKLIAMGAVVSPSDTYSRKLVHVWEQDWQLFQMVTVTNLK